MMRFVPKVKEKPAIPKGLDMLGLPERLLQLLVERGINTPQAIEKYLHPKREDLIDPMRMQDMDRAVAVIQDAIAKNEEIVVFGDYDVDGVTATAILLTYLRKQGAKAGYYIPDRHGEGYGLNIAAIEQIAARAKLLITVDCGITCPREVARARELGMRVIVTDHHQLGPELPRCEAVLNPLLGSYPFRRLCGAGVAFKLVQALGGMEAIETLWELAALATIADIVPLMDENRVIVYYGLKAMAETKRPGLIALMESAGVNKDSVSAADVAFRMAPRINAGGRLALASRGVELLTTRKTETAKEIAAELDNDNTKRRELELDIFRQAEEATQREIDFMRDKAIVICGERWNPGVIGLAASRLVEKYRWPTILLSRDGDICVGSARSIPGVNIHDAMACCRDLFIRFGGHAQAAGLTIEYKNLEEFKRRLTQAIMRQADPDAYVPSEEYDLELELSEVTEELVNAFELMQPTGFGNPAPVFCLRGVGTTELRPIGKEGAHLRMRLTQGGEMRSAIGFRMGDQIDSMPEVIEAIVSISVNVWKEKKSVQCELRQVQPFMPGKAFCAECRRLVEQIDEQNIETLRLEGEPPTGRVRRMKLEDAKKLLSENWLKNVQGTLLVTHSVSALKLLNIHLAVIHAQTGYAFHTLSDRRMFNTLVMAPDWKSMSCTPKYIAALDGFLSDGERAEVARCFPESEIIEVTDMARNVAKDVGALLPDDEGLRRMYKALRAREKLEYTLPLLAGESGLSESGVRCAMAIFNELGLIDMQKQPFSYSINKSGRVSLESSRIRGRLRALCSC